MSNKIRPSVSVIMGTRYVRSDIAMLRRAVESIQNQTYSDFEFLICDDGSSKEARRYLEQEADLDTRIRLVHCNDCFDLSRKLNQCLNVANGEYIVRMDDDDYSHSDRVEKELVFLLNNPDIAFVGCNVSLILEKDKVGERHLPEYPVVEDFFFTQPYIHPALIFRREPLIKVRGYSEEKECEFCEDYDLLLRLYAAGYSGANLQDILLDYTIYKEPKKGQSLKYRYNEARIRYRRFKELGKIPDALPYVIKPIILGLIPANILAYLKRKKAKGVIWKEENTKNPFD